MSALDDREFQAHTKRIEELVARANSSLDAEGRDTALALLQAVMDLHGAVMARLVEVLEGAGDSGRSMLTKLGNDPLICGLLVLYGVNPLEMDKRVTGALEKIRPQLRKQSGSVELLGASDGVVRVKLSGSGHECGSSLDALKRTVEQAILEAAPEVVEIIVEGLQAPAAGFVPLAAIQPLKKEDKEYEESAA
jgi:Fe-S cluster biogenesis protein NfuA